jgi:hypothetical protein
MQGTVEAWQPSMKLPIKQAVRIARPNGSALRLFLAG